MAVVRFSGELREEIIANATRPFAVRHKAELDSLPKTYGMTMYEKGLGRYLPIVQSLPVSFFETMSRFKVSRIKVHDGTTAGIEPIQLPGEPTFEMGKEVPVPKNWHEIKPAKLMRAGTYGGFTYHASMKDLEDAEFVTMVREWISRLDQIDKDRNEFVSSVKQIINVYTTLSPALKVWPPLWDLLPESTRERHREVVDRKKRDPAESLTVDLDKMTGVVTINKLLR